MKEKHFIITLTENLTVKKTSGTINRNSNSTQWIDVELDNWKLGEADRLYIELMRRDEDDPTLSIRVGPLFLIYNVDLGRYVTVAPPELVSVAGEWEYSLEQRFDIDENADGEITYSSITSSINILTVTDSIIAASPTNSYVKEAELATALGAIKAHTELTEETLRVTEGAAKEAVEAAERSEDAAARAGDYSQKTQDLRDEVEKMKNAADLSAQSANESALNAAQSAEMANSSAAEAATSAEEGKGVLNEINDQAAQYLLQMFNLVSAAENSALSAQEKAELCAELLRQFASYGVKVNTEYSTVDSLPVPGTSNNIYFIPNGGEGDNGYDEYVWVDDKNRYEKIGSTDVDLSEYLTRKEYEEIKVMPSTKTPLMAGAASAGTAKEYACGDHVHPSEIALVYSTVQSVASNEVSDEEGRTYAVQKDSDGNLVVNVPWTNTVYTLPAATSSEFGGVKLGSDVPQSAAANTITRTANRTYAIQKNSSQQLVVNVPWTSIDDTKLPLSGGTMTGDIVIQKTTSSDTYFTAQRIDSGNMISFGVGSGGVNRGLWDHNLGKWIFHTDGSKVYVNGVDANSLSYTLPAATSTVLGGVKLGAASIQTTSANTVTTTSSRTYAVQVNSSGQLVVNVPWTNTNTTYSAGTGLSLSGTTFSIDTAKVTTKYAARSGNFTTGVVSTYHDYVVLNCGGTGLIIAWGAVTPLAGSVTTVNLAVAFSSESSYVVMINDQISSELGEYENHAITTKDKSSFGLWCKYAKKVNWVAIGYTANISN